MPSNFVHRGSKHDVEPDVVTDTHCPSEGGKKTCVPGHVWSGVSATSSPGPHLKYDLHVLSSVVALVARNPAGLPLHLGSLHPCFCAVVHRVASDVIVGASVAGFTNVFPDGHDPAS